MKKIIYILLILILFFVSSNLSKEEKVISTKSFITLPNKINIVSKKIYDDRTNIEKMTNKSRFYFENSNFYNTITGLIATNTKKVIDISSYQGVIDWEKAKNEIDGVILRIGFGNTTMDNKFSTNIEKIKELNIPYGIYLYSYAENKQESLKEAIFTKQIIDKFELIPTLGVYYDIEEFYIKGKRINITKENYQKLIETYINFLSDYDTSVYTYAKLYKYKFNDQTKKYVSWIAQYNYSFTYNDNLKMWQYTDSGKINGIKGNVDINVMFTY